MTQLYAQPAAGWYADPSGEHEARYWDGARWTDRVADRGVENRGSDPAPFETPGGPLAGDPPGVPDPAPAPPVANDPEPAAAADMAVETEAPARVAVAAPEPIVEPGPGPEVSDPSSTVDWSAFDGSRAGDPGMPLDPFGMLDAPAVAPESPVDSPVDTFDAYADSPVDAFAVPESPVDAFDAFVDSPVDSPDPVVDFGAFAAPTEASLPVAPVPPVVAPVTDAPPLPDYTNAAPPDPVAVAEAPVAAPSGPEMGWYPDPAGRHEVRYWGGSQWTERVADNGIETTESPAADVLEVAADAMTADPTPAAPAPDTTWPPDWYPDPTGRHEVRYFDGATWTDHVANNGLSALDPIADGAPVMTDATALAAAIVPAVSTTASPNATSVEAAEKAFAAALAPTQPVEEPAPPEPAVLPVHKDWASRPNALVGWIVVAGAGVLGVGSLGPWAKATAPVVGEVTQNGMSGDGRFLLALAFLLLVAGVGLILGRFGRVVAFGALTLGTLAAIVCAVDMARISNGNYGLLQGTADATAAAGIGLWACLAGAIVCIAGGIVAVTHR